MNITQLLTDFNITYWTEGKNCSPGWVSMQCPFCDDQSNHLGYSLKGKNFNCWKCGSHPVTETISKLTGLRQIDSRELIKNYGGSSQVVEAPEEAPPTPQTLDLPTGAKPLDATHGAHGAYLIKRGFDPEKITQDWNLYSTGPVGMLNSRDYKHRIIAPIYWGGRLVSFQARDITGKSDLRYKACPKDMEIIHHKHIIYGKQKMWGNIGICVEGIFDVWRLGTNAFCTFGTKVTTQQIRVIAKQFKQVSIVFDNEPKAFEQACQLRDELALAGIIATIPVTLDTDPASLTQDEADYLIKLLI